MTLKIKESIYLLKESEDVYTMVSTSTRRIKRFSVDSLVKSIIENLKEPKEESDLLEALKEKYASNDINLCILSLEKEGIIRKYAEEKINKRYEKQILFIDELTSSWEETLNLQKEIENSKIAVFGIGGIGTWMVNGLNQIGVGEIRISDPDKISETNLNRQLFFNRKDIGRYKVDVIKSRLPDSKILTYKNIISDNEDLEEIVKGSDFIINCADSPSISETTRIIDRYASKLNIPYCVAGGYNLHLGMVGPIIIPGKTATFNDFLDYQKSKNSLSNLERIKDIEQTGNLGPVAGAIANMQVIEIFKHLIGKGNVNYNKFAEIDFMNLNMDWIDFSNTKESKQL